MKTINICLLTLLVYSMTACSGNDDIKDVRPWQNEYDLPQGKSDADERIMDYYERFGTCILYEYTYLDCRYELNIDESYSYNLPNPKYVGDMLDLLEEIWFDFYPEAFHKEFMPLKIMLAEYFAAENYYGSTSLYLSLSGPSCIGIGFCSDTLRKLSPAVKLEFKNKLQEALWLDWLEKLDAPDDFFAVSDYSYEADDDPSSKNYARNRGFVEYDSSEWSTSGDWTTGELDAETDLQSFIIGMVTRSSEDWSADLEWPLVKQKYDLLKNWLQETYDFDLQKIGDKTYE